MSSGNKEEKVVEVVLWDFCSLYPMLLFIGVVLLGCAQWGPNLLQPD